MKTMEHSAKCQENCLRFIFDDIIRWRAFVRQRFHRSDFSVVIAVGVVFYATLHACNDNVSIDSHAKCGYYRYWHWISPIRTQIVHNSNSTNWTKNNPLIILIIIIINSRQATAKYLHWAKLCENTGLPKLNWNWFNINAKIMWWLHAFGHRRLLMLGWFGIYKNDERDRE